MRVNPEGSREAFEVAQAAAHEETFGDVAVAHGRPRKLATTASLYCRPTAAGRGFMTTPSGGTATRRGPLRVRVRARRSRS